MSKANNGQLIDLPNKHLSAEESADVIRKEIRKKNIVEASRLFQVSASGLKKDDRETLGQQLSSLTEQAEKYFREAGSLENERKLEEARGKYKEVENIVIDFPELPEAFRRIDDAKALIWALQQRDKRSKGGRDKQFASSASGSGKSKVWRVLLGCFFVQLVLVGAGLFYAGKLNFISLKKNSVQHTVTFKKKEPAEVKEPVKKPISSKVEQPQNNVLLEEPGEKEQSRAEFVIDKDKFTVDIVGKSEETTAGKNFPQLQEQGFENIAVTDSEQPQQIVPVIREQDESRVDMFSLEKTAESAYTVQSGDTLGLISMKEYGTSSKWPAIANANKDQLKNNPDSLQIGITLIIPSSIEAENVLLAQDSSTVPPAFNEDGTYTVQFGDSLSSIAQKLFGNSGEWKQIYELNRDALTATHRLKVGQILRIKASAPDENNNKKFDDKGLTGERS